MARFKTNMNKLKADQGAFDTGGGGSYYKLTDGKHLLRILPPWAEDGLFYQKVGFHRPPGRENVSTKVICPDYTFDSKGTCPICKAKARVYKQLGKDAAKDFAYQKRAYLNVLNMRKNEDGSPDTNVYTLEAPATVMNPILNFMAEENSDQLLDPSEGYNVLITRKKDKGFTKYEVMVKPGNVDLAERGFDVDEILESLHDLGAKVTEPDPEDFQEILNELNEAAFGGEDGGSPEEDDDAPPAKKLKSAKVQDDDDDPPPKSFKKKAAAPVEEDEDDAPPPPKKKAAAPVAEEEDPDDEPAPAPAKPLKKKAAPAPVADDDDDDAPAPPVKKKAAVKAAAEDDLDNIEDFDDSGFDADEEVPW